MRYTRRIRRSFPFYLFPFTFYRSFCHSLYRLSFGVMVLYMIFHLRSSSKKIYHGERKGAGATRRLYKTSLKGLRRAAPTRVSWTYHLPIFGNHQVKLGFSFAERLRMNGQPISIVVAGHTDRNTNPRPRWFPLPNVPVGRKVYY